MERSQRVLTVLLSSPARKLGASVLVLVFGGMLCSLIAYMLVFNNYGGFPEARVNRP